MEFAYVPGNKLIVNFVINYILIVWIVTKQPVILNNMLQHIIALKIEKPPVFDGRYTRAPSTYADEEHFW